MSAGGGSPGGAVPASNVVEHPQAAVAPPTEIVYSFHGFAEVVKGIGILPRSYTENGDGLFRGGTGSATKLSGSTGTEVTGSAGLNFTSPKYGIENTGLVVTAWTLDIAGPKTTLTLTVRVVRSYHSIGRQHCAPRSGVPGSTGTIVLVDDKTKLANGHAADSIKTDLEPPCNVHNQDASNNADNPSTPSPHGLRDHSGNWAVVHISARNLPVVLPTSYTLTVTTAGTCTTPGKSASITLVYGKPAPPTPKIVDVDPACSLAVSGTVNAPLPPAWDLNLVRQADPISPGNGVYYSVCHAKPGTTSCNLCPPAPGLLPANVQAANTTWQKFYTAPCGPTITRPRRTPHASVSGEFVLEYLSSPTGWTAIGVEIDYNCQQFTC